MTLYMDQTIKLYLDDLAARLPAPGGGSAAALAGAMATALTSMVLNFTVGNEKFKDFEEAAKRMLVKSEGLRENFTRLFTEDIKGYEAVASAYSLPKDTEANKTKRKRAVKDAMRQASLVPLHVCEYSVEAMKLCPDLAKRANPNLICDVEVPVRLLEAAFYGGKVNVIMNLKSIEDDEFNKDVSRKMAFLEKELFQYKDQSEKEIVKIVTHRKG